MVSPINMSQHHYFQINDRNNGKRVLRNMTGIRLILSESTVEKFFGRYDSIISDTPHHQQSLRCGILNLLAT